MNRKTNWAIGLLLIAAVNAPTIVPIAIAGTAKSQPTDPNPDPVNPWDACRLRRDCPTAPPFTKKDAGYEYPDRPDSVQKPWEPQGDVNKTDQQKYPSDVEKKSPTEKNQLKD